jgi:hypothetical protein
MNAAKRLDHLRRLAVVAAGAAVVPLMMSGSTATASNGPTQVSPQVGAYLAELPADTTALAWKQCGRDVQGPQTTGCGLTGAQNGAKVADLQGLLSSLA